MSDIKWDDEPNDIQWDPQPEIKWDEPVAKKEATPEFETVGDILGGVGDAAFNIGRGAVKMARGGWAGGVGAISEKLKGASWDDAIDAGVLASEGVADMAGNKPFTKTGEQILGGLGKSMEWLKENFQDASVSAARGFQQSPPMDPSLMMTQAGQDARSTAIDAYAQNPGQSDEAVRALSGFGSDTAGLGATAGVIKAGAAGARVAKGLGQGIKREFGAADIPAPDVNVVGKAPEEFNLQPDAPVAPGEITPAVDDRPFRPSEKLFRMELEGKVGGTVPYDDAVTLYKEAYPDDLFADKPRQVLKNNEAGAVDQNLLFGNLKDYTLSTLLRLPNKPFYDREQINQVLNQQTITSQERAIINKALGDAKRINQEDLLSKIEPIIMPLEADVYKGREYENNHLVTWGLDRIGIDIKNRLLGVNKPEAYTTVYKLPGEMESGASNHFDHPGYVAHERGFDIGDQRSVIELQSDAFQQRSEPRDYKEIEKLHGEKNTIEEAAQILSNMQKGEATKQFYERFPEWEKEHSDLSSSDFWARGYRKAHAELVKDVEDMKKAWAEDPYTATEQWNRWNGKHMKYDTTELLEVPPDHLLAEKALGTIVHKLDNKAQEIAIKVSEEPHSIPMESMDKAYWQRMVRESVKEAAKDGHKTYRLAHPDTVVDVEGWPSNGTKWRNKWQEAREEVDGFFDEVANLQANLNVIAEEAKYFKEHPDYQHIAESSQGSYERTAKRLKVAQKGLDYAREKVQFYLEKFSEEAEKKTGNLPIQDDHLSIYKRYQKEIIPFFEKNFNAKLVEDHLGNKWYEAEVPKNLATEPVQLFGKQKGQIDPELLAGLKDLSGDDLQKFLAAAKTQLGNEGAKAAEQWWTKQVQDKAKADGNTAAAKSTAMARIPGLRDTRREVGPLESVLKGELFDKDGVPKYEDISKQTRWWTGMLEKPDFFTARNPLLQWVQNKVNSVEHNTSYNADKLIWGTEWKGRGALGTSRLERNPNVGMTLANRLPAKEQAQLAEALLAYQKEVAGSPTGPYRSLANLNKKQREAFQNYRDMMDGTYQYVKDSINYIKAKHPQLAKELNLDAIYDAAYVPHSWIGDYRWHVTDGSGKVVSKHSTSGATATMDKMSLQGRYPKDHKWELVATEDFIPGFRGHLENPMPLEMGGYEGTQGGWKGAKALWNASELYVRQAVREAETLRLRSDLLDLMNSKDPRIAALEKHMPNSLDWSRMYLKNKIWQKEYGVVANGLKMIDVAGHNPVVGLPKDVVPKIVIFGNNLFLSMKLGFNPRSWFGNTIGPITQVDPFLMMEASRLGIKDMSIVNYAKLKGAQDFFTNLKGRNDALRYGYESGALHPKFVEALDYEKTGVRNWNDLKNKWGETAMHVSTGRSLAGTVEEWGRGLAYLTAVNFYEKAGLKGNAAYAAASEATNKWVGRYGHAQNPQIMSGSPLLSKALSPLHTFMHTYFASTGEFVRHAKEKGEFRPLLNHLGYVAALGGAQGMIGVGVADQAADILNEHGANVPRPSTAILKMAEKYKNQLADVTGSRQMDKFVDSYAYGMPAAWLDWNVSESLGYPSLSDIPEAGGLGQLSDMATKTIPTGVKMLAGGVPSPKEKYEAAVAGAPTIIRRATIDPYFSKKYIQEPPIAGVAAPKFSGFPQPTVEGDELLAGVIIDNKDAERTRFMLDPLRVKIQRDKFYGAQKENQAAAKRAEKLAAKNYNRLRAGYAIDMDDAREIAELTGQMGREQASKLITRFNKQYTDKEHRLRFGPDGNLTMGEKLKAKRSEELWPQ